MSHKTNRIPVPNITEAEKYDLPQPLINLLQHLPKPTLLSTKSKNLIYSAETRFLAAIIKEWGLSLRTTAAVVGMRSDNNVRTAVEAYLAGAFDNLICPDKNNTNVPPDTTSTQYLQDFLDDAEAELEDLQKRFDALKRKNATLEKAVYTLGYADALSGRPMDKKYT